MLLTAIALLPGCNVIDPAIQVPSYIHIDKIDLTTNYSTQGTSSAKITDAWVYVNDQYAGTFQLPVSIPVLAEGNCKVSVDAGIKINGIAATRGDYPFYIRSTQNLTLKRGEKLNTTPVVSYFNNVVFSWKEDFETIGISMIKGPFGSDTTIQKTGVPDAFEGNNCGVVYLTGNYYENISSSSFSLPCNGDPVYMELNYKTNNAFTVGLYSSSNPSAQIQALTINPNTQWNKIYVNLSSITQSSPSTYYTVYFSMSRDAAVSEAILYIDNIKLVHL